MRRSSFIRRPPAAAPRFSSARLISGAVILVLIMLVGPHTTRNSRSANWSSVVSLFAYVTLFSFLYLSLSAATGALILFGAVQLIMFILALRRGEHFTPLSWGLTIASLRLIYPI
jgi:hypothetical protein